MSPVLEKLQTLGIHLPEAPKAVANYLPAVRCGDTVIVSGQLPLKDGQLTCTGKLGDDVTIEAGYAAARQCAINALAALNGVIGGDWSQVAQVVRLGGFVASAAGFTDQPKVVNGASDFMVEVFGEAGRHARAAVGVAELPLGAAVEVEFTFRLHA
ncbi:MAG: RidA family protein [Candidatus Sericytochromatia bacterium]|nr:RidA family protein [Candidatus Sericytochromatia bacterium]